MVESKIAEDVMVPLRRFFDSGRARPLDFRRKALEALERMVRENRELISAALYADLRKPPQEALIAEIGVVLEEIAIAKKNVHRWMRPARRRAPFILFPSRSRIHHEPLGVALIIGPWNYPFQLVAAPLVGALAAGNCVVIKPSELAVHTSRVMCQLIKKYFDPGHVTVVEGGVPETTALLKQKFDHIFFTGSTPVGKVVMTAAAQHLTPVTLELGGKSPVIVCPDADLDLAARRIVWGKFYNAGQTCVAPDYVYAHQSIEETLLERLRAEIQRQFGHDPQESGSYSRIVNERTLSRLERMITPEKVFLGGRTDRADRYFEPTILRDVSWSDSVMQDEIFGPILPVLKYNELDEAYAQILSRPKPLAAYIFSRSKATQRAFIDGISFGGGCVNDVLVHLSNPYLPFGGVGASGIGSYHGYSSFLTFSHSKSVMLRYGLLDLSARYAPYTEGKLNLLRRFFGL